MIAIIILLLVIMFLFINRKEGFSNSCQKIYGNMNPRCKKRHNFKNKGFRKYYRHNKIHPLIFKDLYAEPDLDAEYKFEGIIYNPYVDDPVSILYMYGKHVNGVYYTYKVVKKNLDGTVEILPEIAPRIRIKDGETIFIRHNFTTAGPFVFSNTMFRDHLTLFSKYPSVHTMS